LLLRSHCEPSFSFLSFSPFLLLDFFSLLASILVVVVLVVVRDAMKNSAVQ